jgi:hypothetical protein
MRWKGCGRYQSWPNLRYYPGICMEGLRKPMKNISQASWSQSEDVKSGPPKYEAGVLPTQP